MEPLGSFRCPQRDGIVRSRAKSSLILQAVDATIPNFGSQEQSEHKPTECLQNLHIYFYSI